MTPTANPASAAARAPGRRDGKGGFTSAIRTFAALFLACNLWACGREDDVEPPAVDPVKTDPVASAGPAPEDEGPLHETSPDANSEIRVRTAPVQPASAAPATPRNENDLVDELRTLDWGEHAGDAERAASLLRELRARGADALIPLRDFLLDNDAAGEASPELRRALLDVLLNLGVPEVEGIALELLTGEWGAYEVWQIGRFLESNYPGQHSAAVNAAAQAVLVDAGQATALPPEFFLLLGEVGDADTALLLSGMPPQYEAFARVALASIDGGMGIPALERDARQLEAGRDSVQARLAVQLLAQQAPRSPEAAATLIALAEQGVIPAALWPYVLDLVAGNWELSVIEPAPGFLVGSHTFYQPAGDQVIYRVARQPGVDDGLDSERLFLLDRLQRLAPPDLQFTPDG